MAGLEVQLVGEQVNKAEQIQARLQVFVDELSILEKQIQVVDRYIQRLHDGPSNNGNRTAAGNRVTPFETSRPKNAG